MTNVLVRYQVANYYAWRAVFDAALESRHRHGEVSCRIFHAAGDADDLILFFEWDSLERARAYFASEEMKAQLEKAGVEGPPRVEFATEMYTVRRSAAD
jgi:heme-degrading monooxygenase HmoA